MDGAANRGEEGSLVTGVSSAIKLRIIVFEVLRYFGILQSDVCLINLGTVHERLTWAKVLLTHLFEGICCGTLAARRVIIIFRFVT